MWYTEATSKANVSKVQQTLGHALSRSLIRSEQPVNNPTPKNALRRSANTLLAIVLLIITACMLHLGGMTETERQTFLLVAIIFMQLIIYGQLADREDH